jgi:transaldolase/glucose-6-phosphate isomerase
LVLESYGQSIWMDFIRRGVLDSGELVRYIAEDGIAGVTSNPSIFEKAITGSHDYDEDIRSLALEDKNAREIYQLLTLDDIQHAADIFRPLYDQRAGQDGFVSLEVSPHLAHNTQGTITEARQLWAKVNRPNVMIKVPGTRQGLPAIQQLISEGINVNITLLFGLPRYHEVMEAYLSGLEARVAKGASIEGIASVASFFLSRIDVLADPMLEKIIGAGGPAGSAAAGLHGKVAIASAKTAYDMYQKVFTGDRFRQLAEKGARTQRLLWASTSTKNPQYSDVMYVEALIGPDTINTLPVETINAYRDHGQPQSGTLLEDTEDSCRIRERLDEIGIDLNALTQQLEDEGVEKFNQAYDQLMAALEEKRKAAMSEPVDRQVLKLGSYEKPVQDWVEKLAKVQFSAQLWRKEPGLWKSDPKNQESIRNGLGWLHAPEIMEENLGAITKFVEEIRGAGFRHVLHMGMGGSSLAPLVFERTQEVGKNGLPLTVLDTTDPATILQIERGIPLAHTLFIVASKSGTTREPLAFGEYFYAKVKEAKGEHAGDNFVAITDPGTPLERLARERGFRKTFLNFADIGGRYSALSFFGLVPAALMDINVAELVTRALRVLHASVPFVPVCENPGLMLGTALGELAKQKRDKLTFLMPEAISSLGMWLEQLIAESTGKDGSGILPVTGEPVGETAAYGPDRVFVNFEVKGESRTGQGKVVEELAAAGHPVINIHMDDLLDIGQEFFRWEIATASAGAILGINAFDQPNVQESKDNTNRLLEGVRLHGHLPQEEPSVSHGPLQIFMREKSQSISEALSQFLGQVKRGDYLALLAYLPENQENERALQAIRRRLRDRLNVAATLGYGPRYLHSTGQYHKGGPNDGLFILLTADDAEDAAIPGATYSFGTFKRAQALGDLEALRKHGRRVIRVHLGADVKSGLAALKDALEPAHAY